MSTLASLNDAQSGTRIFDLYIQQIKPNISNNVANLDFLLI